MTKLNLVTAAVVPAVIVLAASAAPAISSAIAVDGTAELVEAARADIADIIRGDVRLAAKFVRLGFHDCVGGCDGCLDLSNGDNAGLDVAIAALDPVVETHAIDGVTRADLWALAALEGASGSQPPNGPDNLEFSMDLIGRANCEDANDPSDCVDNTCSQDRGPDRHLPSPDLDTHGLLEFFADTFDFDAEDTVAIMGAHSIGRMARENSGFNGPWVGDSLTMNNDYYKVLVGGQNASSPVKELINAPDPDWNMKYVDNTALGTPSRWEWEQGAAPFVMTNSDVAIVRDLAGQIGEEGKVTCSFKRKKNACPHASETLLISAGFKFDNAAFLVAFESAFKRMLATVQQRTVLSTARKGLRALGGRQQ